LHVGTQLFQTTRLLFFAFLDFVDLLLFAAEFLENEVLKHFDFDLRTDREFPSAVEEVLAFGGAFDEHLLAQHD